MKRTILTVAALSLTVAGVAPAQQQQSREQLEQQLREMQRTLTELRRQVADLQGSRAPWTVTAGPKINLTPRVYMYDSNRPHLGVFVHTDRNAETDSIGALLDEVSSDGPAADAGLKAGDIITKLNGERLAGPYPGADEDQSEPGVKLTDMAGHLNDGDSVKVEYRRGKDTRTTTVVARPLNEGGAFGYMFRTDSEPLRAWGFSQPAFPAPKLEELRGVVLSLSDPWLDMETTSINNDLGEYFGTTKGLLVLRAPRDSALNLKSGDVILSIDGRDIATAPQMYRVLRSYDAGDTVHLDIMRQKRRITISGKVPDRNGSAKMRRHPPEPGSRGMEG
jgi:predicted metalloprotease with PDZ domain